MASSTSPQSTSLFSLARSKLHLSVGGKGDCSLHRWVLLKNSIIRSPPSSANSNATNTPDVNAVYSDGAEVDDEEEVGPDDETDSFMFPDAGKLVDSPEADINASEAEWLDSLLETLGDEDGDEYNMDVHVSVLPVDDDELLSPSVSPMSSSDDLTSQPAYYPPPIAVPYPVPYPPFHPPLIRSFELDPMLDSPLDSSSPQYAEALPYYDIDDVEDLSVPDAIEDTSDDESDAPTTPSMGHSRTALGLIDPASIPLPLERTQRRSQPHVYIDSNDSYFYPFELDPLPFPEDHINTYNTVYQEC